MKTATIVPLRDRVLIEYVEEDRETQGGIVLPDVARDKRPQKGKVIAVGMGFENEGKWQKAGVEVGETVYFQRGAGTNIQFGHDTYCVLESIEILAVDAR